VRETKSKVRCRKAGSLVRDSREGRMFSCCLRTTRGSGLKKDNRKGHDGVWRHRVLSCLQRLWPFSKKGKNLTKASQGNTDQVTNLFSMLLMRKNISQKLGMRETNQKVEDRCQFQPSTLISLTFSTLLLKRTRWSPRESQASGHRVQLST